jgi:hypothetical protein
MSKAESLLSSQESQTEMTDAKYAGIFAIVRSTSFYLAKSFIHIPDRSKEVHQLGFIQIDRVILSQAYLRIFVCILQRMTVPTSPIESLTDEVSQTKILR